jgi:UDP-N-acetyl-D-glucosamine dehydrogenase
MKLIDAGLASEDRATSLKRKIADHTARVGVIGIGYVGLPLAVEKAKVGFSVVGIDRNPIRVAQLNQGSNYIRDVKDSELATMVATERLRATTEFDVLSDLDVIIICVPTPLTPNKDPDISYIRYVAGEIAERLRPGQLISLESTTYPGTTEEVLLPTLSKTGLVVGKDYFLAFSPERVDPGNARYTTKNTNKIVGGVTPVCLDVASSFYQETIVDVVRVSSPRVAEMVKVFENTFRSVNIALVNELALLCDRMDINVWEVVEAASTKPFGLMRFDPGPGVGGHCIPLDPFYLAWKAREYDVHMRFIELAGEINISMPYFVREKVNRFLNNEGKAMRGAAILIIGVSYKKDIDDWRESPALKIIDLLESEGAKIDYHDPHVPSFRSEEGTLRHSVPLTPGFIAQADCVIIATDHVGVDYALIVDNAKLVVDTRNATRTIAGAKDNVKLL